MERPNIYEIKKKVDVKGLVKALEHDDDSIREHAADALGKI